MIFCIAGTGDGRALALRLRRENWPLLVSVVSEYGERLVKAADLPVVQTALDQAGMEVFLQEQGVRLVVDASHPYAVNVSRNAMAACEKVKVPYVRYERPASDLPEYKNLHVAVDYEEAARLAAGLGETIFLTTGSRQLGVFRAEPLLQGKRLVARVLPEASVLEQCRNLGFLPKDIVAMQGPFSLELNQALYRAFQAEVVVLKNSGNPGGCAEKIAAAVALGLQVVLVDRPRLFYPVCCATEQQVLEQVAKLVTGGK